jgi:hypothetical protein
MRTQLTVICVGLWLLGAAPDSRAERAEFTLDPTASRFTVSGTIDGRTIGEQTPGSMTTGVGGLFIADIDRAANSISLSYGSDHTLQHQSVQQRPSWDNPGPGQALFGMFAGPENDPLFASIPSLHFAFGLEDAPINGRPPTRYDEFQFGISDGSLYTTTGDGPVRYVDLHGYGGGMPIADAITLTRVGSVETLTVPLRTTFDIENGRDEITLSFEGRFVGVRVVPEPGAATLALLCSACLTLGRTTRRVRLAALYRAERDCL